MWLQVKSFFPFLYVHENKNLEYNYIKSVKYFHITSQILTVYFYNQCLYTHN